MIGLSSDVRSRVQSLAPGLPDRSRLLWVFTQAGSDVLREVHERLDEWRLFNDWFALNSDTEIELVDFAREWDERDRPRPDVPVMISLAQFSKLANVCHRTAYRWVKSGRLTGTKVGKNYRVSVRDVLTSHPGIYEAIQDEFAPHLGHSIRF